MAGFFGLFNYDKPGPGVSKDAPKKRSFFVFWEIYLRKFWKLSIANLLYVLVSLPVVTGGLAQAGLTVVTRNYVREKHVFLPSDFFDTIKKNWKQALGVGILELVFGVILVYDIYFFWINLSSAKEASIMMMIMMAAVLFLGIIYSFTRYYIYLQLITFKMSMKQLLKNSVLFAIAGMKQNVLISVILVAMYALAFVGIWYFTVIAIPIVLLLHIFLFPAFRSFLIQFMVFPLVKKLVIDPYYEEHPDEDVEARRNLNIETEEVQEEKEEVIFEDRGAAAVANEPDDGVRIPKQYNADDMRRGKRLERRDRSSVADDDDVI